MKSKRLFLILTLLILISDMLFVGINYYTSQRTLRISLSRDGINLKHEYDLTLALVSENMLQLSTYISNQQQVKQLFQAGKAALIREGGGAGGVETAKIRDQLFRAVSPSWIPLMEQYDARQLHFHLGPGSLSFLRVHAPDKYGDRMDEIRHIIVDSYRDREIKTGFEVGRVYAGLRGVTPMWGTLENGETELIGVLEVGTSYQTVLEKIYQRTGVEMLVMLNQELVHSTMWPESINKRIFRLSSDSPCYVEALSNPQVLEIIERCDDLEPYKTQLRTFRHSYAGMEYAVTHFPLYDYRATTHGRDRQAGMVVMLSDISDEVAAHRNQLKINLIYAVVGFAVVEVLLYLAITYGSRKLHDVIRRQTGEILQLKEFYKERSERDSLTGLYNHRNFNERLQQEMYRSERSHAPLSILMCDLDDFKTINDQFGHLAGDAVLEGIAELIREVVRASDFAGRYGGEEFTIALLDIDPEAAVGIAHRLLERIADFDCASLSGRRVTASIGVASWDGQQSLSAFIQDADDALYVAKQGGKNRVEFADTEPSENR
ncbi:MAG: diguanylate cyclase [Candidatus Thiodiazotropha sp. (ex Ctena orbiculata)]|nr:diguanylate cyclase [Candidatus Thiodiazotropha taylori]PUB87189.1 MAG: hypothetical protein DBP00_09285 [gamma proteobacterium symbiont of Ctena orbiculata]MBT2995600.1 diguanylate cyclase [Candidatus Thiodiazotropha taylori]MBT2999446.1 diguanylate cyclase [Candidatus Thiodiazotropha taylori]MBT3025679.1 diguanylate cyclase [Candidatus Thiodiazotropha taylori]